VCVCVCARAHVHACIYVCIYDTAQSGLLTALLNKQQIKIITLYTCITTAEV